MKVDTGIMAGALDDIAVKARELEESGYDGLLTAETGSDPFLPLVIAAEHTERIELGTGIAVAFARTPMLTAYTANDLQRHSKGRFFLGLGSQIKPHIERRFSMPWSHPAPRMREYILAMRAIWASWQDGSKLDFRGDFYTHTLMTPFFSPGPNPYGPPKVFLAAVGALMTEVGGEVADGMIIHGFTTERYVREVTMPAHRARARQGRPLARRLRGLGSAVRRHRHQRRGVRGRQEGHAAADRVLRIDARVPAGARAARLGRSAAGAQRAVEAGRVGEDGRADRRRRARRVRGGCRARCDRSGVEAALRRGRRPVLVLRAVQVGSRPWAAVIADLQAS